MGEMVTIPLDEYERLKAAEEDLRNVQVIERFKADLAAGREELIPADIVKRMIEGESPLRVWRDFRGLNQSRLAAASGVNRVQIADIEAGRSRGSVDTMKKLADALKVTVDDLI